MAGVRGRRIEPVEESSGYERLGFPVTEKTDRELKKSICEYNNCPKCDNIDACEFGKEAIRRGFFGGPDVRTLQQRNAAKRHEWAFRGVSEGEERQEGWQSVAELAQEYGLSYQSMYGLLHKSGVQPVAKIVVRFSRGNVHRVAYYSAAEAVRQIVMHCARVGNQKMVNWFASCGVA